jgi:hypothetical protein
MKYPFRENGGKAEQKVSVKKIRLFESPGLPTASSRLSGYEFPNF